MISTKISGFCKSEDCPSSNDLLDFQKCSSPQKRHDEIRGHLESCEFCSAEVAFYSHYPQEEGSGEAVELAGIPAPLFELAEALLKNRHSDPSSLDALLKKKISLAQNLDVGTDAAVSEPRAIAPFCKSPHISKGGTLNSAGKIDHRKTQIIKSILICVYPFVSMVKLFSDL